MTEELSLKMKLYQKMAKVRAEVPPIPRDSEATVKMKSGGSYTYSYAKLQDIVTIVNPVLDQYGLFYNWVVSAASDTISVVVVDLETGYSIESSHKLGDDPENFQDRGKQLTYYSRYLLLLILGIVAEDDDDGSGYMSAKSGRDKSAKSAKSGKSTRRTKFRTSSVDEDEEPDEDEEDEEPEEEDDEDDDDLAKPRRGFTRRPPTARRSW